MADAPRGRGRARGRARQAPQPVQQPAPAPAAARAPPPQVGSGGAGGARPPVGRSTAKPQQQGAGDLAARASQLSISSGGNGSSDNGNGSNGNGNGGKPVGRGAVRPSREGEVLKTKPPNMGPKQGSQGDRITLYSNFFELKTTNAKWELCKHHVDISPQEDRTFVKKILMRQHRDRFHGFLFDGSTLFTFQNACPNGETLELVSKDAKTEKTYNLKIKFVGTVLRSDYQYLQIFNIIMRECQGHLKLQLIRRNYYDPSAKVEIPEHKLELWPGYVTAVTQCENSIMLQAEISYKTLRRDTAYDILMQCHRDGGGDLRQEYSTRMIGAVVITLYNNKTYRVDEVDFGTNPNSTFPKTKRGETTNVRYIQYFEERYGASGRIKDAAQPMLISRPNARERRAGAPELIYLVPELCVMTGLNDQMRANFQLMKAVAQHTCVNPGARMTRLKNFSARLNSIPEVRTKLTAWGLELSRDLVQIPGRILPAEKIYVADGRSYDAGRDANWDRNLRSNKMLQGVDIKNWVVLFLNRAGRDVKEFCNTLSKVASGMRYTIQQPTPYELQSDRIPEIVNVLDRAINEKNPQIVMCILPNNRADRYSAIKKKCILDKPVPSQVVLNKTIMSKGVMSIATKVAIQMNCKVGGAPWCVDIPMAGLMTIGYDVCHDPSDKRRSYGAMVATLDRQCVRWYSNVTRHSAGEELSTNFALNVQKAMHKYKELSDNKDLPNVILIFRDGVGEGQIGYVLNQEVEQIKAALQPEYAAAGKPLRLCFVIVTKRINTRIFSGEQNPIPGTIVDDVITDPNRFDFFLVSQSVRQGTVSPTHYNCIENSAGLKPDHVQRLAYKFTHLYFNWSGTVAVPAPCQYAHKLAFLTAQNVGAPHSNLDRLLYFL